MLACLLTYEPANLRLASQLVPDVPDSVRVEAEREEYIQERIARDPRGREEAPAAPPLAAEASQISTSEAAVAPPTVQTI